MKVLVCGNINSGKSHCINILAELYKNFSIIQIDEWRRRYSDGTIEGEQTAQQEFVDDVLREENVFVELSGLGPLGNLLAERIKRKSFILLYIKERVEICLDRLATKQLFLTPYPKSNEKIEDTIIRIDKELGNNELYTIWKDKAISILEINDKSIIPNIPILHYKYLVDVINIIKNNDRIKEIILFGSIVRNELNNLSDIDIFLTTDYSINEIEDILSDIPNLDFIDNDENKIYIIISNILVEIFVVKNIKENINYYVNSYIIDISNTIIKGNDETYKELFTANTNFSPNIDIIKNKTVKRLIYFVLSLERIAKKGDNYKFFFHNNIIIHEITHLLYFNNNKIRYEYLPHNALNYYDDINIQDLVYDFIKDKYNHIHKIKITVYELLRKMNLNQEKYNKIFGMPQNGT